jgi:hypothetical protein
MTGRRLLCAAIIFILVLGIVTLGSVMSAVLVACGTSRTGAVVACLSTHRSARVLTVAAALAATVIAICVDRSVRHALRTLRKTSGGRR